MTDDDDDHRRQDDVLHIVNCHLSGGSAPERRLRQVNDGLEQIRKWTHALKRDLAQRSKGTKKRPLPSGGDADGAVVGDEGAERMLSGYRNAGIAVCGDFKSDGNTAVRRLLVDGRVDPDWREPQYPDLPLSSRIMEQSPARSRMPPSSRTAATSATAITPSPVPRPEARGPPRTWSRTWRRCCCRR